MTGRNRNDGRHQQDSREPILQIGGCGSTQDFQPDNEAAQSKGEPASGGK
jgi:hypothetical protein